MKGVVLSFAQMPFPLGAISSLIKSPTVSLKSKWSRVRPDTKKDRWRYRSKPGALRLWIKFVRDKYDTFILTKWKCRSLFTNGVEYAIKKERRRRLDISSLHNFTKVNRFLPHVPYDLRHRKRWNQSWNSWLPLRDPCTWKTNFTAKRQKTAWSDNSKYSRYYLRLCFVHFRRCVCHWYRTKDHLCREQNRKYNYNQNNINAIKCNSKPKDNQAQVKTYNEEQI